MTTTSTHETTGTPAGRGKPTLRAATKADVETIATTLASALKEDPALLYTLGGVADPEARLRHTFASMAKHNIGVAGHHVALTADGASAVMWRDVDKWRSPVTHHLRMLPALLRSFHGRTLRLLRALAMMEKNHPTEPHLYLEVLGTHADHQGRGLGSIALAPMLERCDREGLPAYTESGNPKNLAFYFRHGFNEIGQLRCDEDSPPIFQLWRTAR